MGVCLDWLLLLLFGVAPSEKKNKMSGTRSFDITPVEVHCVTKINGNLLREFVIGLFDAASKRVRRKSAAQWLQCDFQETLPLAAVFIQ